MDETSDALEKATALVKTGRLSDAKNLLLQYLRQNPSSEQAWLLMSYTVSDSSQQKDCLERVLQINPQNTVARSKLALLTKAPAPPAPMPPVGEPADQIPVPAPSSPPPAKVTFPIPKKDDTSEAEAFPKNDVPVLDAPEPSRLSRLRARAQANPAPEQVIAAQNLMAAEPPPETEKPKEELQESFHMGLQGGRAGMPLRPVLGILAAAIVILLIIALALSGVFHFSLTGAKPTPIPSSTPISLSLPPAWTKTPTLTPTITPTITETPTPTISPTATLFVSRTPTKPKK